VYTNTRENKSASVCLRAKSVRKRKRRRARGRKDLKVRISGDEKGGIARAGARDKLAKKCVKKEGR